MDLNATTNKVEENMLKDPQSRNKKYEYERSEMHDDKAIQQQIIHLENLTNESIYELQNKNIEIMKINLNDAMKNSDILKKTNKNCYDFLTKWANKSCKIENEIIHENNNYTNLLDPLSSNTIIQNSEKITISGDDIYLTSDSLSSQKCSYIDYYKKNNILSIFLLLTNLISFILTINFFLLELYFEMMKSKYVYDIIIYIIIGCYFEIILTFINEMCFTLNNLKYKGIVRFLSYVSLLFFLISISIRSIIENQKIL